MALQTSSTKNNLRSLMLLKYGLVENFTSEDLKDGLIEKESLRSCRDDEEAKLRNALVVFRMVRNDGIPIPVGGNETPPTLFIGSVGTCGSYAVLFLSIPTRFFSFFQELLTISKD